MSAKPIVSPDAWVETEAEVTSCQFQFAGLGNMAFGFSTRKKFRIGFDYTAIFDGEPRLYSDEFQSDVAIAQGERLAIGYNPLHPEQNSRTSGSNAAAGRNPLVAVGILGSVVLALVWMVALRGCN